jgi:hypothetical protein
MKRHEINENQCRQRHLALSNNGSGASQWHHGGISGKRKLNMQRHFGEMA